MCCSAVLLIWPRPSSVCHCHALASGCLCHTLASGCHCHTLASVCRYHTLAFELIVKFCGELSNSIVVALVCARLRPLQQKTKLPGIYATSEASRACLQGMVVEQTGSVSIRYKTLSTRLRLGSAIQNGRTVAYTTVRTAVILLYYRWTLKDLKRLKVMTAWSFCDYITASNL